MHADDEGLRGLEIFNFTSSLSEWWLAISFSPRRAVSEGTWLEEECLVF